MHPRPSPAIPASRLPLAIAAVAVAWMLWTAFCYFPADSWNAIRVTPSVMMSAGASPYAGPGEGPVTTWIYGPVPSLLLLPAALFGDVVPVMLAAGVLNLLLAIIPVLLCVRLQPGEGGATPTERTFAVLLALACWPPHNLYFFQADNAALALGLLGNLLLALHRPGDSGRLWLAAALSSAAVWSKQTEVGLVLGQLIFCMVRHGLSLALRFGLRVLATAGAFGCVFAWRFGAEGLWFNMFVLPARLPSAGLAKLTQPEFIPFVLLYAALPAAVLAAYVARWCRKDSPWLLPACVFFVSLPFHVAGLCLAGGSVNALHAHVYLIPTAALAAAGVLVRRWRGWSAAGTVLALMLAMAMIAQTPHPWKPFTRGLKEARSLARQLKGEIYFPWNPLITWFEDGVFYHTEDGLKIRRISGETPTRTDILRNLPPHLCVIAYQGGVDQLAALAPRDAMTTWYGQWRLISWSPAVDASRPPAP